MQDHTGYQTEHNKTFGPNGDNKYNSMDNYHYGDDNNPYMKNNIYDEIGEVEE